jgi:hypothetical protein
MRRVPTILGGLLLTAALGAVLARGAATDASILSCSPAQVVPGENITCTIGGRDATYERTQVLTSDFLVSVLSKQNVDLAVSPVTPTDDQTIVQFTISSQQGTYLNVLVNARNGRPISGSGFQGLVFASPPTGLGDLTCDSSTLMLRTSTTCSVPALGENGVPAMVAPKDVYYSEDHGDGQFTILRGDGAFVFKYTAPNSPSTKYDAFMLRIYLQGAAADQRNISIPMTYPIETATDRSTLTCSDSDYARCTVNAASAGGPVLFNSSDFAVDFEEDAAQLSGTPQWQASSAMVGTWQSLSTAQMQSSGNLYVDQRERNNVFRVRIHVRSTKTGIEITGSPHVFVSGTTPTSNDVTFRLCTRTYLVAGRTTTCYLSVSGAVSAAPRYMTAGIASGTGSVTTMFYVNGSQTNLPMLAGQRLVAFNYTAPTTQIEERMDVQLSVTIQGLDAIRSPFRVVVFPNTIDGAASGQRNLRPPVIALGLCFFGTVYILGFAAFWRRQQRLRRVASIRRELAAEKERDFETEREAARERRKAANARTLTSDEERQHAEMEAQLNQTIRVRKLQHHERSMEGSVDEMMPKAQ